jgi:hypothetical protein
MRVRCVVKMDGLWPFGAGGLRVDWPKERALS